MSADGGVMLVGEEKTRGFQKMQQYFALRLEIKGLRHSQGSVYAHVKRTYNLKGNKQRVCDQFGDMLRKEGILR